MRAVGIVGFKKSGKTTLALKIAKQLISQGYQVAAIKHVSENIEQADTDSEKYKKYLSQVIVISPGETILFLRDTRNVDNIINFIEADFVLIEGFKNEKTFPKIVCLREQSEKEKLLDGLEICTATLFPEKVHQNSLDYSILKDDDVRAMTKIIIEKAFKLPNLNCGGCGLPDCYGLAKAIIKGNKSIENCVALNSEVEVVVDGKKIPLNPFMSKMVKNTTYGMFSTLKGFKPGNINLKLKKN